MSVTEEPFDHPMVEKLGLTVRHFPVDQGAVPKVVPTASLCRELTRMLEGGERIAVHGNEGLDRVGMLRGALLTWQGDSPERAIRRVRDICSSCLTEAAQQEFVTRFASAVSPGDAALAKG